MKKALSIIVTLLLMFNLSACQTNQFSDDVTDETTLPDVDLSVYEAHGEWSCGRVWVEETVSDWEDSTKYISYLDEYGNKIAQYTEDPDWPVYYIQDYYNDFVFVGTGVYRGFVTYDVLNLDGKKIAEIECVDGPPDPIRDSKFAPYWEAKYQNFNTHGYAAYVEPESGCLYILTSEGKKIPTRIDGDFIYYETAYDEYEFEGYFSEGYMPINNTYYINEQGEIFLDFTEGLDEYLGSSHTIVELCPIEDGLAKIVFEGADDNLYFIVLDLYGNLLTSDPVSYDKIDSFDYSSLQTSDNSRVSNLKKEEMIVGNVVKFGNYEQDNIATNGDELIEWQVLSVDNNKALLISTKVLDSHEFYSSLYDANNKWENSVARSWLNNEFYNGAFNDEEKKLISKSKITTKRLYYKETYDAENLCNKIVSKKESSNVTSDNVFLLSSDEIKTFVPSNLQDANGTKYFTIEIANQPYPSTYYFSWACRDTVILETRYHGDYESPVVFWSRGGKNDYDENGNWTWIGPSERLKEYSTMSAGTGMRPAIYIDLEKLS